jgi:hypothetical protein
LALGRFWDIFGVQEPKNHCSLVIFAFFFPHSLLAIENLLQNHFSFQFVILISLFDEISTIEKKNIVGEEQGVFFFPLQFNFVM